MRIPLFIIALIGIVFQPLIAQEYTLDQAVEYAKAHHPENLRQGMAQRDAKWQIKEYWSTGIPTVEGSAGYTHYFDLPVTILPEEFVGPGMSNEVQFGTTDNVSAGLAANLLLFDGSFLTGLKAQREYKELVELSFGETLRDIAVNVTKAYLNVLVIDESLEIIQSNIDLLAVTKNETEQMHENGFVEQLDVDRLELALSDLNTELHNTGMLRESALVLLKFHMGYPIDEDIELSDDLAILKSARPMDDLGQLNNWSVEDRVEFAALDQSILLSDINIDVIKKEYLPTLRGNLAYQQQMQTNELFGSGNKWFSIFYGGLTLGVPIYDGGNKRARINRAQIQKEKLEIDRSELVRAIYMEVETARINYLNAVRIIERREASKLLAEKIYNTTQIKYQEGVGSSLEVNQAESDMTAAQRSYIDALFDYLNARVELERALGFI